MTVIHRYNMAITASRISRIQPVVVFMYASIAQSQRPLILF